MVGCIVSAIIAARERSCGHRTSRDLTEHGKNEHVSPQAAAQPIRDFARYFCAMALGQESDNDLKLAFMTSES